MKLPEKVTLYCRESVAGIEHAFPVDSTPGDRHETAKRWAENRGWKDKKHYNVYEYPNSGFDHVEIIDLEVRDEGGRAYQVLLYHDNKIFKVDLREKSLMDVIKNTGIQAGGRLNGTFCFVVDGSQTRLTRENSEDYFQAQKDNNTRGLTTIKKSDLKIGHLYESLNGDKAIYCGEFYVRDVEFRDDQVVSTTPVKKMCFYEIPGWMTDNDGFLDNGNDYIWAYKFKSSHSYRIHHGEDRKITQEQVLEFIHKKAIEKFEECSKTLDKRYHEWTSALSYYNFTQVSTAKDIPHIITFLDTINKYRKIHESRMNKRW